MKYLLIVACFFSQSLMSQENAVSDSGKKKIEIYVFNEKCIPVPYLKGTTSFHRSWYDMAHKFKPKGVPIFTKHDVVNFDIENFQIELSETGWTQLEKEQIPTNGIPVMLVIDDKIEYGAWIWSSYSSSICDGVSFLYMPGDENKALKITQSPEIKKEWRIPNSLTQ